jgi:hypothetical protein
LAVSGDSTFTTSPTGTAAQDVIWTNLVNVTASGNSLTKTSGCDGCPDAGATSQQQLNGDGYVEFSIVEANTERTIGLSNGNTDTTRADIDFALFFSAAGAAQVFERGAWITGTNYIGGETFRIAVESGVVKYYKNGTLFYTSTDTPTYPLQVDTSLLTLNGTITNAVISGASGGNGLVGYWNLDEGSGTLAADSSGNGNSGTLMNGPLWTAGKKDQALSFDGIDDYVSVPHTYALNAYPLTVAFWMKTNATGLSGIVNKYFPGSLNGYQVFLNSGNLCAWYFKDASNYIWDGTGCTLMTPGINDNQWYHVAFVVDATGGRLYVDAVEKASWPWTGIPGATSTTQALSLGSTLELPIPIFRVSSMKSASITRR